MQSYLWDSSMLSLPPNASQQPTPQSGTKDQGDPPQRLGERVEKAREGGLHDANLVGDGVVANLTDGVSQ